MAGRLEGKVALITGGAGVQGAEEAELFIKEGASIVVADINDEAGRALEEKLCGIGGDALYVHLDISVQPDWEKAVEATAKRFGKLHILINNAGINAPGVIPNINVEEWERVIRVNLTGSLMGIQTCAPLIRDSGGGSIINIGSTAGLEGHWVGAYSASKWALRALTRTAAYDLAPWGIRANNICPGLVETPMSFSKMPPEVIRQFCEASALKRACKPIEVAYAALFLASDESSFITAIDLPVDGGFTGTGVYGQIENAGKALDRSSL